MTVLVVGASGATGRLLVEELLSRGQRVKAVVRSPGRLPDALRNHDSLSIVHANLLELSDDEMTRHVSGCTAVASCLGHNLTFKGIYGSPRHLVTDATRRLCEAIRASQPRDRVKPRFSISDLLRTNNAMNLHEKISKTSCHRRMTTAR